MQVQISNDFFGGSLLGEMDISYDEIVALLGNPGSDGDGYKVDAEWTLLFSSDEGEHVCHASIYNYKSGPNYNGGAGDVESIRDWHIGGEDDRAVELVKMLFSKPGRVPLIS